VFCRFLVPSFFVFRVRQLETWGTPHPVTQPHTPKDLKKLQQHHCETLSVKDQNENYNLKVSKIYIAYKLWATTPLTIYLEPWAQISKENFC